MALVATAVCLSLAGTAPLRAHAAATRHADDGVQKVACDGNEDLDLYDTNANATCYGGTGYLGLGSNAVPNVVNYRYFSNSGSWLRVYNSTGGYWQDVGYSDIPTDFPLRVLVTQMCLNCGQHISSGIQRIDCADAQLELELDLLNRFGYPYDVCFSGSGYVGLGDPGQDGDLNNVIGYYYTGQDTGWLGVYDNAGGHWQDIGPDLSHGSFNGSALVTQICLSCGYHS